LATTFRNESLNLSGYYVTLKDKTLFTDASRERISPLY